MLLSLRGVVLAMVIALPGAFFSFVFPPREVPEGLRRPPVGWTRLTRISQCGVFASLLFGGQHFLRPNDPFLVLFFICMAFYVLLWLRYMLAGRAYRYLFQSFLWIPIPMTLAQGAAVLCLAFWGRFMLLGIFAIAMSIGRINIGIYSKKDAQK